MTLSEPINPEVLRWAREAAGLELAEAARKLGLQESRRASAAEKLHEIEVGEKPVTLSRLEKAASVYARPLAIFYLLTPPAIVPPTRDFRLYPDALPRREQALLEALVRDVIARQSLLRDVLEDDDDALPLPFIGRFDRTQGPAAAADDIRRVLGVTSTAQKRSRTAEAFFTHLRQAAEAAGIYVLLLGDLGSYHTDVDAGVFRGFALADPLVPFVVINDNDAPAARSFTLIHELAHLWIGESGISGPVRDVPAGGIERFCNEAAENFLLPSEALADVPARFPDADSAEAVISRMAQDWKVSRLVVTYRLARLRMISKDIASDLFARFRLVERPSKREKEPDEKGPSYYIVRQSRLGAALLDTVRRAMQADALTHTRAAKILGVRPTAVSKLLEERQPVA